MCAAKCPEPNTGTGTAKQKDEKAMVGAWVIDISKGIETKIASLGSDDKAREALLDDVRDLDRRLRQTLREHEKPVFVLTQGFGTKGRYGIGIYWVSNANTKEIEEFVRDADYFTIGDPMAQFYSLSGVTEFEDSKQMMENECANESQRMTEGWFFVEHPPTVDEIKQRIEHVEKRQCDSFGSCVNEMALDMLRIFGLAPLGEAKARLKQKRVKQSSKTAAVDDDTPNPPPAKKPRTDAL